MGRVYQRKAGARPYRNYAEDSLEKAIEQVANGKTFRDVSAQYGIPIATLSRKFRGLHSKAVGRPTALSNIEERNFVTALSVMAEWGFLLTAWQVKVVILYQDKMQSGSEYSPSSSREEDSEDFSDSRDILTLEELLEAAEKSGNWTHRCRANKESTAALKNLESPSYSEPKDDLKNAADAAALTCVDTTEVTELTEVVVEQCDTDDLIDLSNDGFVLIDGDAPELNDVSLNTNFNLEVLPSESTIEQSNLQVEDSRFPFWDSQSPIVSDQASFPPDPVGIDSDLPLQECGPFNVIVQANIGVEPCGNNTIDSPLQEMLSPIHEVQVNPVENQPGSEEETTEMKKKTNQKLSNKLKRMHGQAYIGYCREYLNKDGPAETTEQQSTKKNNRPFKMKYPVCKNMFLSTLGCKEQEVRYWLTPKNPNTNNEAVEDCPASEQDGEDNSDMSVDLKNSQNMQVMVVSGHRSQKIFISSPREKTSAYNENNNLSEEQYLAHIKRKEDAQNEKKLDKERAVAGEVHAIVCDLMKVECLPPKRQRSANFSEADSKLLVKLANQFKHIQENKKTDAQTNKSKAKCWVELANLYNANTAGPEREAKVLRLKYECIKKAIRRTTCGTGVWKKTGGGPQDEVLSPLNEEEKELRESIILSCDGLQAVEGCDSDFVEDMKVKQYWTLNELQDAMQDPDFLNQFEDEGGIDEEADHIDIVQLPPQTVDVVSDNEEVDEDDLLDDSPPKDVPGMGRHYQRVPGSRKYRDYTPEILRACLEAIGNGDVTLREAEIVFGIPKRTICYKLKKQHCLKPGRPTVFSKEEELAVVECIIRLAVKKSEKESYKLNFPDELRQLPYRAKPIFRAISSFPQLIKTRPKIARDKFEDLQWLKRMMPVDCHPFKQEGNQKAGECKKDAAKEKDFPLKTERDERLKKIDCKEKKKNPGYTKNIKQKVLFH
ncbi:hypothetical protein GE061_015570 [Apolygus lucorum]|uniref:Regulatory protein zeste n=1 Tax=Apolygus lucorum TaxID=248454 RepID=A0A8S9XMH7_APOLU|nr:hypothetical protein GE061_015570 [Apolygus lucorum]